MKNTIGRIAVLAAAAGLAFGGLAGCEKKSDAQKAADSATKAAGQAADAAKSTANDAAKAAGDAAKSLPGAK